MEKKKLLIIGAGGHSKVVSDSVNRDEYQIVGILDKDDSLVGKFINDIPIIGTDKMAEKFFIDGICHAVIGIGHLGNYHLRNNIFNRLKDIGYYMVNIIHPSAIVSETAVLGEGNVILPNATINSDAMLLNNNIINTGAIVEHDVKIGNNVHMGPGTIICGMSQIADNTFVGAGSTIIQGIKIGRNVIVGAGSTVLSSIEDNSQVCGTPAKIVKRR